MNGNSYWAWIVDENVAHSPTLMAGHEDRHSAAQSYVAMIVEDNEGDVLNGAVRVWDQDSSREEASVFDFSATLTPYEGDDAEEGEIECILELTRRE